MDADAFRRFIADRLPNIRAAAEAAIDGRFQGRLLLRTLSGEAEAWRCEHEHHTHGLAMACALAEVDALALLVVQARPERSEGPDEASSVPLAH